MVFAIFSIYWGALWKVPDHKLVGWVVDLDGGSIGSAVSSGLLADTSRSATVAWRTFTAGSAAEVSDLISEQKAWVAVVINRDASTALENADTSYDGTQAVTVFVNEARNENAFRTLIRPYVTQILMNIGNSFAVAHVSSDLVAASPQALVRPIGWTLVNIHPFNVPVASAITFVGLIYLLVLCYFIVLVGGAARLSSGLEPRLTTASLIRVRLASTILFYFTISLFYSTLSRAFQVDFSRKFGRAGFPIFWMLNFTGMLSLGLALESMITLVTPRFMPFFMILWIIVNVSTTFMPLEVLPRIYHYGYGFPFYNVSGAVRTILFGTKNELGLHFGVLIAWTALSVFTLILFQWFRRRGPTVVESKEEGAAEVEEGLRNSREGN
ncbi:hypothetical protein BDZ89DRAFT_1137485 [Hymenopellis radicata]|nr:hypothetical protein BDZ89DRAFT_1137485 [Hymenopellis radicata]